MAASGWSAAGEPLDEQGRVMGGIMYDVANLGTFLTLHEGRPVIVHNGNIRQLA